MSSGCCSQRKTRTSALATGNCWLEAHYPLRHSCYSALETSWENGYGDQQLMSVAWQLFSTLRSPAPCHVRDSGIAAWWNCKQGTRFCPFLGIGKPYLKIFWSPLEYSCIIVKPKTMKEKSFINPQSDIQSCHTAFAVYPPSGFAVYLTWKVKPDQHKHPSISVEEQECSWAPHTGPGCLLCFSHMKT